MLTISNPVCANVTTGVEKKFSTLMVNKLRDMPKQKESNAKKNLYQNIQALETKLQYHQRFDVEGNKAWFEFVEVRKYRESERLHKELGQNLLTITKIKRKIVMYCQLLLIISF